MRCLSPHPNYSIQVIEGEEKILQDVRGFAVTTQISKPLIANFERSGLADYEVELALESFNFSGLPEGVNPLTKVSVFDTEAYVQSLPKDRQDEMLVQIDKRLRELQLLNPSQFIVADPPAAPRPWPSYDEDKIEDILKFQERLRIDPEQIRRYEIEHQNRPEIVKAMFAIENPDLDLETITVDA